MYDSLSADSSQLSARVGMYSSGLVVGLINDSRNRPSNHWSGPMTSAGTPNLAGLDMTAIFATPPTTGLPAAPAEVAVVGIPAVVAVPPAVVTVLAAVVVVVAPPQAAIRPPNAPAPATAAPARPASLKNSRRLYCLLLSSIYPSSMWALSHAVSSGTPPRSVYDRHALVSALSSPSFRRSPGE